MVPRYGKTALGIFWIFGAGSLAVASGNAGAPDRDVENFLRGLKRGAYVRLDLRNGGSIQGRFSDYDEYYGRVWVAPEKDEGGLFRARSVRLSSIRRAEPARPESSQSLVDAMLDPQAEFMTPP